MCVDFRRRRYAYDKGQEARRVCAARCCIRRVSQGLNDLALNFRGLNLFSRFGRGSRKFGLRENFPLYGTC